MANKVYYPGRWWLDLPWRSWNYTPAGYYEEGVELEPTITVDGEAVRQLISALDEAGWIVPRLDVRLREEDLKITHRLLDLLEKRT